LKGQCFDEGFLTKTIVTPLLGRTRRFVLAAQGFLIGATPVTVDRQRYAGPRLY